MEDATNKFERYHSVIKTKHVCIENNQVFMKRNSREPTALEYHGEVWYPINFQWIPVIALKQNLEHQPGCR